MIDIYGGKDPRDIPTYTASTVARYLKIPESTIRSWTRGYNYSVNEGNRKFSPPIEVTQKAPLRLSFTNLIEVHVLRAIRQDHKVNLKSIRTALDHLSQQMGVSHPLARQEFKTDGVDLFVENDGRLMNASKRGQSTLKESFNTHLDRIEPDDSGLAIQLYPFTRSHEENNPRIIVIDPRIAFGRSTIAQTGITTDIIMERFQAGDSQQEIAKDYECEIYQIEEAIRCETLYTAA